MAFWNGLRAGLRREQLPATLDWTVLAAYVDCLWNWTVRDDVEWGGCLVWTEAHGLRMTCEIKGRHDGVEPRHLILSQQDHVGFFHTHPLVDGRESIGFSDRDFVAVLEEGDPFSLVRSGLLVFALVRTNQTPAPAPVSPAEEARIRQVFIDEERPGRSQDEAELRANYRLCREFHFAFYRGLVGEPLRRLFVP